MYELKRSKIIKEKVKVGEEVLETELNLSENANAIIKLLRKIEVIQVNLSKEIDLEKNLKELGEVTVDITKMVFGTNFEKVLRFYAKDESKVITVDNACVNEMITEILPFVLYLKPQIENFIKEKREDMNKAIKGKRVE